MKKVITSLLAAILVSTGLLAISANAEEGQVDDTVVNFNNGQTVEINDETKGQVSEEMLNDIAEQAASNTNDKNISITISKVSNLTDDKSNIIESDQENTIQPLGVGYTDYVTSRTRTRWNVVGAAKQITSVARGGKKTFTASNRFQTKFSTSVSGGISGIKGNVEAGLTSTYTYKSKFEYNGPKSPYISTIFYVTPYFNHGTWKGYRDWWVGGADYYSGSFVEYANKYIEWSQDIK